TPTKGIENLAFDRNTDSLFEELSSAGTGLIGDVDEGADLLDVKYYLSPVTMVTSSLSPVSHSLAVIHNPSGILWNALNVVNKDLILKVDELTCEKEVLQGEMEALLQAKNKIEEKNRKLEEELKNEVPTAQRKRFTRVEMARVLMERNQYKERLMELQEAVRWTEMISMLPCLSWYSKCWCSFTVWLLTPYLAFPVHSFVCFVSLSAFCNLATCSFSRLFSSSSSSSVMKTVEDPSKLKYNSPGSLVKRSSTFSQFPTEKSKIFDFMNEGSPSHKEKKKAQYRQVKAHMQKEDGRVTVHGWSLPSKHKVVNGGQMENKMNLPVPVYLRPLDQKDASMKVENYPAGEEVPQEPEASQGDGVSLAGSVASVGSTGSDGAAAAEGVTAVLQTASLGVCEQPAEYSATSGSGSSLQGADLCKISHFSHILKIFC
ncbi:hypothetical protein GOODEAATRI_010959, partial [Goodea atripinnis]